MEKLSINIEQYLKDGRLTESIDKKIFDYRKMYDEIKRIGRILTREETEQYRIK